MWSLLEEIRNFFQSCWFLPPFFRVSVQFIAWKNYRMLKQYPKTVLIQWYTSKTIHVDTNLCIYTYKEITQKPFAICSVHTPWIKISVIKAECIETQYSQLHNTLNLGPWMCSLSFHSKFMTIQRLWFFNPDETLFGTWTETQLCLLSLN